MVSVSDIGMKTFSALRSAEREGRVTRHEFDRKECEFASQFVSARHDEIRLEGRSVNPEAGGDQILPFSPVFPDYDIKSCRRNNFCLPPL